MTGHYATARQQQNFEAKPKGRKKVPIVLLLLLYATLLKVPYDAMIH